MVYLGEHAHGSEQIYTMFVALAYMRAVIKTIDAPPAIAKAIHDRLDQTTDTSCLEAADPTWTAARAFLARPWLTRVSVVQEVKDPEDKFLSIWWKETKLQSLWVLSYRSLFDRMLMAFD